MSYRLRCATVALMLLSVSASAEYSNQGKSQLIYDSLVPLGASEAVVDVSEESVLITYEQPPAPSADMQATWFYMMAASAKTSPKSRNIILVASSGGEPILRLTVATSEVQNYLANRINAKTLASMMVFEDVMSAQRKCPANAVSDGDSCVCTGGMSIKSGVCLPAGSDTSGICCLFGLFSLPALAAGFAVVVAVTAYILMRRRKRK